MLKTVKKLIAVLLAAVSVLCTGLSVSADELSPATVAGLPDKLVVLDDKGRSVSENNEYCFEVENMTVEEVYSKNIQIMNLREDASYNVYFNAEPIAKFGDIDLEEECEMKLFLDNELIYHGKVTGEGQPDVRTEPLDLGRYSPGKSRVLRAEIVWHDSGKNGGDIDNGYRIYDSNGVKIVRAKTDKTHIEGEVIFKWIFSATAGAPHEDESSDPGEFIKTGETILLVAGILFLLSIPVMFLLLITKKKKQEQKNKK